MFTQDAFAMRRRLRPIGTRQIQKDPPPPSPLNEVKSTRKAAEGEAPSNVRMALRRGPRCKDGLTTGAESATAVYVRCPLRRQIQLAESTTTGESPELTQLGQCIVVGQQR
jgi:hypothetical protein